MVALISGAIAMGLVVIALFFLRFWRGHGDRFFLYFALSFLAQAADRVLAAVSIGGSEVDSPLHYLIRLIAYALIIWAILEKNLSTRGK